MTANQQVRFRSESKGEGKAAPADMPEDKLRVSRTSREGRHTTSTPTSSDRDQRLKEEFEGVSTIKEIKPLPEIPGREASLAGLALKNPPKKNQKHPPKKTH